MHRHTEAWLRDRWLAISTMVRETDIEVEEARRWFEKWERFADRQGVPRGPYFWDSGRGWIDALRFEHALRTEPARVRRSA